MLVSLVDTDDDTVNELDTDVVLFDELLIL